MKNKTANFLIVIIGVVLFSASSWVANKSLTNDSKNFFEITDVFTIIGAILVLFAIINITSIIFNKTFNENVSANELNSI